MGQALCGLSSRQRRDGVVKSSGYRFFESQKVPPKALAACLDHFLEGSPDKDGTLSYDQFARLLLLKKTCTQTKRLCHAFDADNSGTIDFREFVYGLSKFHTESFDAEVQFAFRLFDLDGSGALEPHEALIVLRDALRSDLVGGVAEELSRTQEGHLKKVLEEVVHQTGREVLGPTEFAMVCTRAPRVYLSAKLLYQKLCKLSKDPCKVVMALSPEARHKLLAQSGRVSMHLSSAQSSGQVQQQPHFGADALSKSVYKPTPKRIMEPPPMRAPLVIPGYATLLAHRESETRRLDVPRASSSAKLGGRGGVEPGMAGQMMNGQASGVSSRPQSPMLPPAGAGPGGPRQSQAAGAPPRQSQAAGAPLAPHLANGGGGGQRPQSAGRPPSGGGAAGGSRRLSAQTGR